jgi:DNA mismatch repair protein MutL
MQTIHELSESVRSKIAAGEVIERPAYIVKELAENAIDAGADSIRVDIEGGGIAKIIVTDNGIGMGRQDILLSAKRYTTSKITHEDDLTRVRTMGFRGEALASIAAVSKLIVRSRLSTTLTGYELQVENGQPQLSKKGMPRGTQIIVQQIFSSVPARQKFLKSADAEYRLISELLMRYALAFPEIALEFIHDGRRVFYYKKMDQPDRVRQVFGEEVMAYMIPIEGVYDYLTIHGYIARPQLSSRTLKNELLFVNKRFVHEPLVSTIIKRTYGTLLEPGRHPYAVLFLTIPHQLLDVNVHPRKESIHFVDIGMVTESLKEIIEQGLTKEELYFIDKRWSGKGAEFQEEWRIRQGGTETKTAKQLRNTVQERDSLLKKTMTKPLTQYHHLYIVVETEQGFLFVDQHAAHERILYEKLLVAYDEEKEKSDQIQLSKPIHLSLSPHEYAILKESGEVMKKLGFMYDLSPSQVLIQTVPAVWEERDAGMMFRDLFDEFNEVEDITSMDTFSRKMITYLACRSAVKAGDPLEEKEMRELLSELQKVKNPYTCPHGRPIQVEIELQYVNRLFKR